MRSVLDTNIVSEMIRNPQGRVTARVQDVGEGHDEGKAFGAGLCQQDAVEGVFVQLRETR